MKKDVKMKTRWRAFLFLIPFFMIGSTSQALAQHPPVLFDTVNLLPDSNEFNAHQPTGVLVNQTTNKVYVANAGFPTISIIDGSTNKVTNILVKPISELWTGNSPMAVNEVTNRTYFIANYPTELGVVEGTNNDVRYICHLYGVTSIGVNETTNKIYVPCATAYQPDSVKIIDGNDDSVISVPIGVVAPCDIAVNERTNKIYVSGHYSQSVSVIDGATNDVREINIEYDPGYGTILAVNDSTNRIYVTGGWKMTVIDGEADSVIKQIDLSAQAQSIVVNRKTNKVYILEYRSGIWKLAVIDGEDHTITEIPFGAIGMAGLHIDERTNKIYMVAGQEGYYYRKVLIFNGADESVDTVMVGQMSGYTTKTRMAINQITGRVYLACNENDQVAVINETDNSVQLLTVGVSLSSMVANSKTGKVYVADWGGDRLAVIKDSSKSVSFISLIDRPSAIAVNEITNKVYVTNDVGPSWTDKPGYVSVIDGDDKVIANVEIEAHPIAIAVNRTSNRIYVATSVGYRYRISVIDGTTDSVVSTISVSRAPKLIAVNERTGKIYVACMSSMGDEGTLCVVDDATGSLTNISTTRTPEALAVNETTNKIYVAMSYYKEVAIFDGDDYSHTTVTVVEWPKHLAVNELTNKIYVCCQSLVSVIDGLTDSVKTLPTNIHTYAFYDFILSERSNLLYVLGMFPIDFPRTFEVPLKVVDGFGDSLIADLSLGVFAVKDVGTPDPSMAFVEPNKIYCLNLNSGSISIISESPDTLWAHIRGPQTIANDQERTYTISCGNQGYVDLESVTVSLMLPPEIEYVGDTGRVVGFSKTKSEISWDVGTIRPGEFKEIMAKVRGKEIDFKILKAILCFVEAWATAQGYNTFKLESNDRFDIWLAPRLAPDLIMAANGTGALLGRTKTYHICGYNDGGLKATDVSIVAYHDPKVTYVSSCPAGVYDPLTRSVTWDNLGDLCPNCVIYKWIKIEIPANPELLGKMIGFTSVIESPSEPSDEWIKNNNRAIDAEMIRGSWDPNDIGVSPEGYGELGYISSSQLLTYFIYFENEGNADAIDIRIVSRLSSDLDDHALFPGPVSDSANFSYNAGSREVIWNFPNINLPPEGTGMVSFNIRPIPDLPSGSEIRTNATIYFDVNPGVNTLYVLNTIDADKPSSKVCSLSQTQTDTNFTVTWSGSDAHSGIKNYKIYVSDNAGPDSVWIVNTTDTSAIFVGRPGHAYSFYSIAEDNVGNIEDRPSSPDATTTIIGAPGLTISIFQNQVLTKFIDLYVTSTLELKQPPDMSIVVGSNSPDSISLSKHATQTYKGSYVFSASGTCSLFVHAVSTLDIVKDTVRLFDVQLIESQSGGKLVSYDGMLRLIVPPRTVADNMYFTCVPLFEEKPDSVYLGIPYQLGPPGRSFINELTIVFPLDGYNLGEEDRSRICIYKQEQDKWIMIISYLDPQRNTISAKVNELGIYRLGYGQSKPQISVPERFKLFQNYPNPFNPITVIQYALPRDCEVQITIYNILGQKIKILINEYQQAGYKRVEWDGKNDRGEEVASGIYFYKIKAGEFTEAKKMVILK